MGTGCASTASCKAGLTCAGGACRPYCTTPGGACGVAGGGECLPLTTADGGTIPNDNVCQVTCDPIDVAACGGGTGPTPATCIVYNDNTTDCAPAGPVALAGNCATQDCAAGLVCVGPAPEVCRHWCRIGHASDCANPTPTCVAFKPAIKINGVDYGSCN
jgi:hypothetical protein